MLNELINNFMYYLGFFIGISGSAVFFYFIGTKINRKKMKNLNK
ncbi:hypothetical protein [uncultured Clostridium sp.]|nr:hypothetical protein [uncultured Clostridium sp.]